MKQVISKIDATELNLNDKLIYINRVAKVLKGGKRLSFSALTVTGDGQGHVGLGIGKANEVPQAVEKGLKDAKKNLERIILSNRTIPHKVVGKYGATKIIMVPASPGTGVIAGTGARAVLEYAGVQDILTKVYGSTSAKNVVKATLNGLRKLRNKEIIESIRGVALAANGPGI